MGWIVCLFLTAEAGLPEHALEEAVNVPDRVQRVAQVDEVVLVLRVDPLVLEVVDEEVHVLGHEVGLDRRQVDAGDG